MTQGECLTRWTIRIALALYVAALLFRFAPCPAQRRPARLLWTAGFVAFLLHLICAFHFYHHWSHDHAYAVTAVQTEEAIGLRWGGGIYVNHVFAAVWLVDVLWWWIAPGGYECRPRWVERTVQGFMAFIAFNATVVFGHGAIRWVGLAATVLVAGFWLRTVRARSTHPNGPTPPADLADESPSR